MLVSTICSRIQGQGQDQNQGQNQEELTLGEGPRID